MISPLATEADARGMPDVAAPLVQVEALVRTFGQRRAVAGVDFTLHAGDCLALFGPNGAGKTTLLRVLAGLLKPTAGRARIAGVHLPAGAEARAAAADALRRMQIDDRAETVVRALSRGMQQRVSIARAVVHAPRVLLLDEPYSGLDEGGASALTALLLELRRAGTALVIVTHNLDEGLALATQSAIMHGGRFVHHERERTNDHAAYAARYREMVTSGA